MNAVAEGGWAGAKVDDVHPSDSATVALLAATQEIKSTAKWITAAFAAVGGVLITGISLSGLGDLSGTSKVVATIGAAVGIAGVLLVVIFATRVLASRVIALSEIRQVEQSLPYSSWDSLRPAPGQKRQLRWVLGRLEEHRWLGKGEDESIGDFIEWLDKWRESEVSARRELLAAEDGHSRAVKALETARIEWNGIDSNLAVTDEGRRIKETFDTASRQAVEAASALNDAEYTLRQARGELLVFEQVAERLRATAQYEYVTLRFDASRLWIVFGAALSGIGVLVFALTTGGGS